MTNLICELASYWPRCGKVPFAAYHRFLTSWYSYKFFYHLAHETTLWCRWRGRCICRTYQLFDLSDWTDETVVPPTDCQSTEFRCADNSCIDMSLRCNAVYDCTDGSDEIDCGTLPCSLLTFWLT